MAALRSKLAFHTVIGIYAVLCLIPLIWMVLSVFKPTGEILQNPLALPTSLDFSVFGTAWEAGSLGRYVVNSVIVTFTSTMFILIAGSMAAFALSRLRFAGDRLLLAFLAAGLLLPIQAYFIAQNQLFEAVGIKDTRWALIVPYAAMGLPIATFLMKSYMDSLPRELFEAARIDGASDLRTYRSLIVPIIRPAMVTVAIFSALSAWNEFLLALLYVQNDNLKTIPTGLLAFSDRYSTDYQLLFAALTIITIPMIAIYVAFNRQIVKGLTDGSVKG